MFRAERAIGRGIRSIQGFAKAYGDGGWHTALGKLALGCVAGRRSSQPGNFSKS